MTQDFQADFDAQWALMVTEFGDLSPRQNSQKIKELPDHVYESSRNDPDYLDRLLKVMLATPTDFFDAPVLGAWTAFWKLTLRWDAWLNASVLPHNPPLEKKEWIDLPAVHRNERARAWNRVFSSSLCDHALKVWESLAKTYSGGAGPEGPICRALEQRLEAMGTSMFRLSEAQVPGWDTQMVQRWVPFLLWSIKGSAYAPSDHGAKHLALVAARVTPTQWSGWRGDGTLSHWEARWKPGQQTWAAWRQFQLESEKGLANSASRRLRA